ncbi:Transcriptional regulator OS=Rhodanobacter lindaniclasticus OX=75310 GN=B1991_09330 PE=4 SV=1 [Rhodanobacter lindaniclasticus]
MALRGIALWLAVAYHETKTATQPDLQAQHRQLLQLLRELKEIHGNSTRDDTVDSWMQESAVA